MKSGCAYCHAPAPSPPRPPAGTRKRARTPLSEKMNDRMTSLKKRLKEIRGE
jgi:hypothetical protein